MADTTRPHGALNVFAAPTTNAYGLVDVGSFASPSFVDIDGDGDLDAVIGNRLGNTVVQLNTGSATAPAFRTAVTNAYGLLDVGYSASPSFVDIDGDGDLDAVIGEIFGNTLVLLNNPVAPVNSTTANNTYGAGSVIALTVAFNENVLVNTAGGTPTLLLETGATDRNATYASGSGTKVLTFNYTVQAGDTSADLTQQSANALALSGGTIKDAAGNNAILTLAAPTAAGSLGANKALVIDGIAPVFQSAATSVNGSKVILSYGEALDAANAAGTGAFTVLVGGVARSVTTATVVGSTVELSLASSIANGQTVTVAYTDPTTGNDVSAIQDSAGNDAATLAATSVTNSVPDTTAPTVANVNSSTANATYKAGDTVSIQVSFSEAITVTGTPKLTLANGGAGQVVNYASGSGSTALTFTYTVQAGDTSADLDYASTSALALSGGTIKDAAGNNAILTLAAPAAAGSLGANKAIVIDTTAPVFQSAATSANGGQVILTYGEALDAANAAGTGAFTVLVGGVARTVTTATVVGSTVELTLESPITNGQTVTVAYTDPTTGNDASAIQDAAGNDAVTLAATSVTNSVADNTAPVFQSAATNANGGKVILTYGEALDAVNAAGTGAFTVLVGGVARTVTTAAVVGSTVELSLATPVINGQTVTVAYTDPSAGNDANAIQDAAGNDALTLAATAATNNVPAPPPPPPFVSVSNGTGLAQVIPGSGTDLPPQQGDTLSLNTSTLADVNGLGVLGFQWLRDGAAIAGATSTSYVLVASDVASQISVAVSYTDGAGNSERLLSAVTNKIQDNDGVANSIESKVPALLPNGLTGDGNGDGVPDVLQLNVTSGLVPGYPGYFTLVADASKGLTDTLDANQAILTLIKVQTAPASLPNNLSLAGLLSLKADVGLAGTKETFSIFVDANAANPAANANGFWLQDASGTWNNIATAIEVVGTKVRIDFAVTDGGAFDADGAINGSIEVKGGAGYMPLSFVGLPPDMLPAGFWF